MLAQYFLDHAIESVCAGLLMLVAFLVRFYFSSIRLAIAELKGRFDSLDERSDGHHTKIAVIENEMRALWRTVDPPRRLSDHLNGGKD